MVRSFNRILTPSCNCVEGKPSLLLFSALSPSPFRNVKLRAKRATCPACGVDRERTETIKDTDYIAFCGGQRPNWAVLGSQLGDPAKRIKATVCVDPHPETRWSFKQVVARNYKPFCSLGRHLDLSTFAHQQSLVFAIYRDLKVKTRYVSPNYATNRT